MKSNINDCLQLFLLLLYCPFLVTGCGVVAEEKISKTPSSNVSQIEDRSGESASNVTRTEDGSGESTPNVSKAEDGSRESTPNASPPSRSLPQTSGVDWPHFLGPTRNSKSTETGILTEWPPEGLRVVWQRELGTGYGIGSISQRRYFQLGRYGNQTRLTCLDSKTGDLLWKFEYPTEYEDLLGYNNGPRTSPVVDDDRVYIFGAEGMLYCLSVTDGTQLWHVDTTKQFGVVQNFFGVGSTPVIENDLLIVNVGGSPPESHVLGRFELDRVDGNGSGVVAFDKHTGQVRYQITDELASYAAPQLATIENRRWCFMFARGGLFGFHPETGKIDFHFPWRAVIRDSVNASTPVVQGNEVLISETYGPGATLLSVKPGGYEIVWTDADQKSKRKKSMMTHWNTPVYHDGYLYGSSGRHEGTAELRCIEWKTGKVQWSIPDLTRSSLLFVEGHFVCLTETGTLLLFRANPENFEPIASVVLRDEKSGEQLLKPPAWAAPILSHGLLYVRGDDRLVCLELIPQG